MSQSAEKSQVGPFGISSTFDRDTSSYDTILMPLHIKESNIV